MNELKRELSKLTGIDFFNPKFREVFKKYFPDDKDLEEEKLEELISEDKEDNSKKTESESENLDANIETQNSEVEDNKENEENSDVELTDNNEEIDNDLNSNSEESQEEVSEPIQEDNLTNEIDSTKSELLDAKIELELIKNGVSTERLDSAKKLAKYEITSLDELGKIKELIKEYPEWVRSFNVQDFGMPIDETTSDLTAEEKRLKEMGIDPRN